MKFVQFLLGLAVIGAVVVGSGFLVGEMVNTLVGAARGGTVTLVGGLYIVAGVFLVAVYIALGVFTIWGNRDRGARDFLTAMNELQAASKRLSEFQAKTGNANWWKESA